MSYGEEEINEWIEDRIEEWHIVFADTEDYPALMDWLGWTWEEYCEWLSGRLPDIAVDQFTRLKDNNAI